MNPRERLQNARLLLVTDPRPDLTSRVEAAVRGGVDVVQLRDKCASREELLPLAGELKAICEAASAIFTVKSAPASSQISFSCTASGSISSREARFSLSCTTSTPPRTAAATLFTRSRRRSVTSRRRASRRRSRGFMR